MKIYSVSNVAREIYRKEAKRDKNIPVNILSLKLSALINNAKKLGTTCCGKKINYAFGNCVLTVNPRTNKIEVIGWKDVKHVSKRDKNFVTAEMIEGLKRDYSLLGLNSQGNAFA